MLESAPLRPFASLCYSFRAYHFSGLEEAILGFTKNRFDCVVKRGK